jgi:hypothetical protein
VGDLRSFCVEEWQQYHFGTKLAAIADSGTSAGASLVALDAAGVAAQKFFDAMSSPAGKALEVLDKLYGEDVDYHGQKRTHDEVLQASKALFEEWPDRAYVVDWSGSASRCGEPGACEFSGKVYFKRFSGARRKNVEGVARFTLRFSAQGTRVISEEASVLAQEKTAEPFTDRWQFESEFDE